MGTYSFRSSTKEVNFVLYRKTTNLAYWFEEEEYRKVVYLVGAGEERFTSVHLNENTTKTPHVNGKVILTPEKHFR